jgi:DNA-binding beta-propeller fold protein YncE/predicted membrane-bound mannosyltransferase
MLVAAFLMVISPYMLYYGRYVRNESFVAFSGLLLLDGILRYLESGEKKYLYLVTAATLLHFTTKETAFIYAAQALLFLGFVFLYRVTKTSWEHHTGAFRAFIILLAAGALLVAMGMVVQSLSGPAGEALSTTETAAPANPTGDSTSADGLDGGGLSLSNILLGLGVLGIAAAGIIYFYLACIRGELPQERSFDLLIVIFTFVLPQLTAFVLETLKKLGLSDVTIPTDAASVTQLTPYSMTIMGIVLFILFAFTAALGLLWNREWWKYSVFYWGIYTILYTTVFTNVAGFFTGVVGSLGYWLVQQGVERGSQPEYYYWLVQIPIYEYLPAMGTLAGIVLGLVKLFGRKEAGPESEAEHSSEATSNDSMFPVFFLLMTWWSISSIASLSLAGERMPWLTVHMAWPMILFTGWAVGQIIELIRPKLSEYSPARSLLSIFVLAVFVLAVFNTIRAMYGGTPPFQGTELVQLQATSAFLLPLLAAIGSGVLLAYLMRNDLTSLGLVALIILAIITFGSSMINGAIFLSLSSTGVDPSLLNAERLRFLAALVAFIASLIGIALLGRMERPGALVGLFGLTIFGLLAVHTMRMSFRASYINYDNATEYLVYAHGATGVKDVMAQVEEISKRTSGGLNAIVAYDASAPDTGVSWPVVWYLRDYTALRSFDQPTRSLREAVAVIVDQKNFDKIEGALGDGFYRFDYIRMWWPNQEYFNLTGCGAELLCADFSNTRIVDALTNPQIRAGIFDVWFDRDYTRFAQATGNSTMTLTTWSPSDQMRLYVRKDVAAQIWNYGVGPSAAPAVEDPYKGGAIALAADQIFGPERYAPLGLSAPRAIAIGLDDDLYVADSRNHRILHLAEDGSLLHEWGSFADVFSGDAPIGTFNEPWGVAVGPDGSVYVTDTWNHRIQKFAEDGKPIKTWGQYGQPTIDIPESASSLWGPRGIAVDGRGRVLVADTGNKRIVIFDKDGNYITEFGTSGFEPGQFDEPVAVTVAPSGNVYVTDTWNQRVQAFVASETGDFYIPTLQWDVSGWFGQSLENKPFIAVGEDEHVFITDPEGYRVIEFTSAGEFVRTWGAFGSGPEEIGLASGIAVDSEGFIWVTDAGNNRILRYSLP